MSKIITILALILLGSISLSISAAQDNQVAHKKHHSHPKETTEPVRNEDWYLSQARKSEQFKAIALERDGASFLPENMLVDHPMQQATTSNHPVDKNNQNIQGLLKKNSSLADPHKITFLFVPPIPNNKLFDNKIIDLQNRSDLHPSLMLLWKE